MYYAIKFFQNFDGETIKRYEFGTIQAPEDAQILEKPSIKVEFHNHIFSTQTDIGRLLDLPRYNATHLRLDNSSVLSIPPHQKASIVQLRRLELHRRNGLEQHSRSEDKFFAACKHT
jgi:hypothetical protein